jgi:hypothetical protein
MAQTHGRKGGKMIRFIKRIPMMLALLLVSGEPLGLCALAPLR